MKIRLTVSFIVTLFLLACSSPNNVIELSTEANTVQAAPSDTIAAQPSSGNGVPSFVEIGQTYECNVYVSVDLIFTVEEIGNNSWVRGTRLGSNSSAGKSQWFNMNQMVYCEVAES